MKSAVVGLGTMGPGMAATLARGGMDVRCQDVSAEQLERAESEVRTAFQVLRPPCWSPNPRHWSPPH
jgi:3-hydroxybutyryl-CoA dehydrogenase/5-formyl-3-hydroxy-2-methylpyridine 4-carboxylate dehydrogenase